MSDSNQTGKKPLNPILKAAMESVYRAEGIPGFETLESTDEQREGFLPVKLWHGTSAHLLPIIKQYGLGGQDVLAKWKVIEFLTWAYEKLDEFNPKDFSNPNYLSLMTTKAAIDKHRDPELLNFEYGDVYVTGQYDKAERYSRRAPELLDHVRLILDVARQQNKTDVEQELEKFSEIKSFLCRPIEPIVIELPPVLFTNLQDENGRELEQWEPQDRELQKFSWEAMSYRVTTVIPFEQIVAIHPVKQTKD